MQSFWDRFVALEVSRFAACQAKLGARQFHPDRFYKQSHLGRNEFVPRFSWRCRATRAIEPGSSLALFPHGEASFVAKISFPSQSLRLRASFDGIRAQLGLPQLPESFAALLAGEPAGNGRHAESAILCASDRALLCAEGLAEPWTWSSVVRLTEIFPGTRAARNSSAAAPIFP